MPNPGTSTRARLIINITVCLFFAPAYGLSAYSVTREGDGDLRLFAWLFASLGVVYILIRLFAPPKLRIRGLEFVVIESAIFAGMLYDPGLDEMAGVLYAVVPFAFLLTFMFSLLLQSLTVMLRD